MVSAFTKLSMDNGVAMFDLILTTLSICVACFHSSPRPIQHDVRRGVPADQLWLSKLRRPRGHLRKVRGHHIMYHICTVWMTVWQRLGLHVLDVCVCAAFWNYSLPDTTDPWKRSCVFVMTLCAGGNIKPSTNKLTSMLTTVCVGALVFLCGNRLYISPTHQAPKTWLKDGFMGVWTVLKN